MKTFLKFLPIAAAVLLATSCSKDDNDNAPATQSGSDGVETVSTTGIPFTIRVNTGRSLKKVGYAESTNEGEKGWYNITFSDNDVAKLKMIIKEGNTQIGEATLQSDKATFSGSLTQQPSSNASLTAEISVSGSKNSSNESLADLLANCAHNFIGEFKFGDKTVDLTDQNAYLAISMSPCCDHEIKINSDDYTVKDGRIWISVPASANVTSTGLGEEISKSATEVVPGTIYTVARQYFTVADDKRVYFSPGNLQYLPNDKKWRFAETQYALCETKNYTDVSVNYAIDGNQWIDFFGWGAWLENENPIETETSNSKYMSTITTDGAELTASAAIGSEWQTLTSSYNSHSGEWNYLFKHHRYGIAAVANVQGIIILPNDWIDPYAKTEKQFKEGTYDNFGSEYFAKVNNYNKDEWKALENNGAVFLPACGTRTGTTVNHIGSLICYWSSTAMNDSETGDCALYLLFDSNDGNAGTPGQRYYGNSVRLVRELK